MALLVWKGLEGGAEIRRALAVRKAQQVRSQGRRRHEEEDSPVLSICALGLTSAAPAFGDPDFGPGNSSKGPNDGGAKCHAPGHGTGPGANDPVPGCKGT